MLISKSALWVVSGTAIAALVQLTRLAVNSRVLGEISLGYLAILMTAVGLMYVLQDFGISNYYIHLRKVSCALAQALSKISLATGFLCSAISLSVSYTLWSKGDLGVSFVVLAVVFPLLASSAIPQARLIKARRVRTLVASESISHLLSLVLFLLLVQPFPTLVSYSASIAVYAALRAALLHSAAGRRRPVDTKIGWQRYLDSIKYGGYQFSAQLLNQVRQRLDVVYFGAAYGIVAVGIFNLTKELAVRPQRLIQPLATRLLMPRLARVQVNVKSLHQEFSRAIRHTSFLGLAIFLPIAVLASEISELLFAKSDGLTSSMLTVFCGVGYLRCIGMIAGPLCHAVGRADLDFRWNLFSCALSAILLLGVFLVPLSTGIWVIFATQIGMSLCHWKLVISRILPSLSIWQYSAVLAPVTVIVAQAILLSNDVPVP